MIANGHKNQNLIPTISNDAGTFSDPKEIGKIFVERFRLLFERKQDFRLKIDFLKILENKAPIDLASLHRPFTLEEVKGMVFKLGRDKAPAPDGFPMHLSGRANLERINWANITLIPKVHRPKLPEDYHPISLINSSLKIISKLLASRLSKVMTLLVDNAQSAFLKGRCITDNITTAKELIFNLHKHHLPGIS